MKRAVMFWCAITMSFMLLQARHQMKNDNIQSLQVVVNEEWTAMPIMQLGSADVLHVGFDELSHNYHRFIIHIEPCNPDWTPTEGLFDSDWMEGFNDWPIEDYENSLNTTVLYTHYQTQLPNDKCRLKMSGNYQLHILDEDEGMEEVATVQFRVVEPLMNVGLGMSTNTDISLNTAHQQVAMTVNYNNIKVSYPEEELQVMVMQNGREDNQKENPRPTYITPKGLQWEHCRQLIFEGGNEYHKFEILDPSHPTMGLAHVMWDETEKCYHAFPLVCQPQYNYTYDEDADGAFYIRNSDNIENDRLSDYVWVHYKLSPARYYEHTRIVVDGQWTTASPETYEMEYDAETQSYEATILQKLGYYNYQLLMVDADGITHRVPEEGSFYQTENRYEALVYYKAQGARTWRLVGYQEITYRQ